MNNDQKETVANILKYSSVIGVIVYTVIYFYDDFKVENTRNFYSTKSYQEYSLFEEEGDALKAKITAPPALVDAKNLPDGDLKLIVTTFLPQFAKFEEECKAYYEKEIPSKQIIDPQDPFFNNQEVAFGTARAILSYPPNRSVAVDRFGFFGQALEGQEEIDSQMYFNIIRSMLICKSQNFNIFIDSLAEAAKEKNWNKEEVSGLFNELLMMASEDLESDFLPDNILFTLNIIKTAGQFDELGDNYFQEIDSIYSELAEFENRFDDMPEGPIKNPLIYYDEYVNQLQQIADETRYLIERKRENKFEKASSDN